MKYIYAGDLVNNVINPQTSPYKITFNAPDGHFHAQYNGNSSGGDNKLTNTVEFTDMFDFYVGSSSAEQVTNTLTTYTVVGEGGETTVEVLEEMDSNVEGVRTEDTADGMKEYRTTSIHYKLNNPAILYNEMLWVPFEGFFYSWNYDTVAHQKCTFAYKDNVAYAMSEYYMKETGKTKESIEGTKQATTTPTQPAQTVNINVGDTVYATTAFFTCWGTVQQVSGSKALVQWSQVRDMYGFMVKDYMDEMDIYSQLSMSKKGIMIGTSTWVDISILNKK